MDKMESIRQEFAMLDSAGLEYHRWMADVETAFVAKECTHTIIPSTEANATPATVVQKAQALRFLKRHIDPNLLWAYHHIRCPKELWDNLANRFGNIQDSLLPQLNEQWNAIRFLDYVKVNDFQKDMLQLQARLDFCGKKLIDDDMIQKTLSTFPLSSMILANQYRMEVDNKRITTFSKLINLLQVAERHNEILANNNARAVGKKKIPEANYGNSNRGKHPKEKRVKHVNSYDPYTRGNNNSRGRGQKGHRGRGRGRGGNPNNWSRDVTSGPSDRGNNIEKPQKNTTPKKGENGNAPCYRCGFTRHWYQQCKASTKVAANYKKYRESVDQEANCVEENNFTPNVNFTISDFQGNKNHALMETSDFD